MTTRLTHAIPRWELIGLLFLISVGRPYHFLYERFPAHVTALIAPVNESLWEHLKLFVVPVLVFALIAWPAIHRTGHNLLTARVAGIATMITSALILTPVHLALFPEAGALGHIVTYVGAVTLGQAVSFWLLQAPTLPRHWTRLAGAALIILGVLLSVYTFWPPPLALFHDQIRDCYGIPSTPCSEP